MNKEDYQNKIKLAEIIKNFQLNVSNLRPIDEVISTIGGVDMNSINETFQIKTFQKPIV